MAPNQAREADGHLVRELHGITLAHILEYLVEHVGWAQMEAQVPINCFAVNPSIPSSLVFLRKTAWARKKVEDFYVELRTHELLTQHDKPTDPTKD